MTHISEMTVHARRPFLVLLAVWRATGESLDAVASPADIDQHLQELGEDPVTDADLFGLSERRWIFDVDFEMTAQLHPDGVPIVREVSDEVVDSVYRARNLRSALHRWIWEQTDNAGREAVRPHDICNDGLSYFGSPYTQNEVGRAAAYLEDKGWIEGPGVGRGQGPIKARLTPAGRAHIEGDTESTPAISHVVNNTFNHSNVAQDSAHVVMSIDNRVSNVEGVEALLQLVRQWQQNLTEGARTQELEKAVADVEAAVRDGAHEPPTKNALGRLKDVIQDSTSGAVGQAGGTGIIFAINGLLQSLGWA